MDYFLISSKNWFRDEDIIFPVNNASCSRAKGGGNFSFSGKAFKINDSACK